MAEEAIDLESLKNDGLLDLQRKLYDIWNNVLQPGSHVTPAEAAKQINELFPVKTAGHDDGSNADGSYTDRAETFLWYLWALLIQIVHLVPHDHSGQTKLVLTLEQLTQLPPITLKFWVPGNRVWTDLPFLGPCMRDDWFSPTYDGEIPDKENAKRWINLNSFAARVLNKGLTRWTNFAIWELRAALEEPPLGRPIMNYNTAVAIEWILQGGEKLFEQTREDVTEDEDRSTQPGILFLGKAGARRERWTFWKMRFLEVSNQVDEDIGERAIRAAEKMGMIEHLGV